LGKNQTENYIFRFRLQLKKKRKTVLPPNLTAWRLSKTQYKLKAGENFELQDRSREPCRTWTNGEQEHCPGGGVV
jgi:hypothetical protein